MILKVTYTMDTLLSIDHGRGVVRHGNGITHSISSHDNANMVADIQTAFIPHTFMLDKS